MVKSEIKKKQPRQRNDLQKYDVPMFVVVLYVCACKGGLCVKRRQQPSATETATISTSQNTSAFPIQQGVMNGEQKTKKLCVPLGNR